MTATETLLKFEELNDEQKESALNHHRDWNVDGGYDWHDAVYEDAKTIAELMGINITNIYFSGFWSQGDGAMFESSFSHVKGILKNVKEHVPLNKELHRIAKDIQDLHRASFYTTYGSTRHQGFYYHSGSMCVDVSCDKGSLNEDGWEEVLRDFADWIYKQLECEHEYLTSDEVIAESLIANEVEFEIDEEGDLIF